MRVGLPIVVDLDGTLVYDDTLYVLAFKILREQPFRFLLLPFKLLRGKAYMKQYMSSINRISAASLNYNTDLINWLRMEKQNGRRLVLCTASNAQVANSIEHHLNIFDDVIGSEDRINLSGHLKANELVNRYGERGFDYCGNAPVDLHVWRQSEGAIVVNASDSLVAQAQNEVRVIKIF